jgi:hypothetical protein
LEKVKEKISSLYSAESWVDTRYYHDKKIIVVKWYNYTTAIHVRKSLEAQIKAMEEYGAIAVIVDSSVAVGVPYPEDYQWFTTTLYPECKRLGLEIVLNIFPKNAIARIASKNWQALGAKFDLRFIEMPDVETSFRFMESYPG